MWMVVEALGATCFTWGVTALGAALVFVLPSDEATQRRLLQPMLGFAGGVMTSAAFFSLLAPALELAEAQYGKSHAWIPVTLGFALGGAGMLACDAILERHGDLDPLELMQSAVHAAPKHHRARGSPPKMKAPSPASAVQRRRMSKLERGASASDDEAFGRDDDDDSAVRRGVR